MPKRVRNFALVALVLSASVGLFAAAEAMGLATLSEQRRQVEENANRMSFLADPEVTTAMSHAQVNALEGMKTPRAMVLGGLAIACAMAFAAGGRLIRSGGLPMEGLRRILSGSLLASAFLRTADGAMWAVVAQRMGRAAAPIMAGQQTDPEAARVMTEAMPSVMLLGVGLHTAIIAGAFLLLGQYFRSDKVKQVVALQDSKQGHGP